MALLAVIFYALFQTFTVGANLWLSVWSEDEEASTDASKRNLYLGVYGALGLLQVSLFCICEFNLKTSTYRGSPLSTIFGTWKKLYYGKVVLKSIHFVNSFCTSNLFSFN